MLFIMLTVLSTVLLCLQIVSLMLLYRVVLVISAIWLRMGLLHLSVSLLSQILNTLCWNFMATRDNARFVVKVLVFGFPSFYAARACPTCYHQSA